jgi:hypothetical protein
VPRRRGRPQDGPIKERSSHFAVAHAAGPCGEVLLTVAIRRALAQSVAYLVVLCSDGWERYARVITCTYPRRVCTGRRERQPLRVSAGMALTQTANCRARRRRLARGETPPALGALVVQPVLVDGERLNGA